MTNEIIIPLVGGLGNQLFQICAGKFLEQNQDTKVIFNSYTLFGNAASQKKFYSHRSLSVEELIDPGALINKKFDPSSLRILSLVSPNKYIVEKSPNENVLERVSSKTKYVFGYFQDVKIVDEVWKLIRQKMENSDSFSKILGNEKIERIAIHARYGDYLSNPKARAFHGLTENSYYIESVEYLRNISNIREVNIYTDNYEKAKSIFAGNYPEIKANVHSSNSAFDDFLDISRSSNIIINNSSFSWWAAYIGAKERNSTVVFPKPWYAKTFSSEIPIYVDSWKSIQRAYSV